MRARGARAAVTKSRHSPRHKAKSIKFLFFNRTTIMNKIFTLLAAVIAIPCTAWAGYPTPQFQKAVEAYNQEHYESALEQFGAIVAQKPADGYAWGYIARIKQHSQQPDQALEASRKALDHVPQADSVFRASLHSCMASSYAATGDTAAALEALGRAVAIDMHGNDYRYQRASLLMKGGRYSQAEADYRYLAQADTLNPDGFMGLGSALDCQGRPQEALEAYNQAVARFPADDGARAFRAAQYFNLQRYSEAADDAIASLELKPDNRHALWVMRNLAAVAASTLVARLEAKQAADAPHASYWASLINQYVPPKP